jgi:two-component system LytT family response regulator
MIIDDEPLAREGMRELLQDEEAVDIVGECGDGASATEEIRKKKPDLILLDIQMPELDGFDVLRALDAKSLPAVIFVTAFDEYAVRAFRVHALDYLLKPVDPSRLREAIRRARQTLQAAPARGKSPRGMDDRLSRLLADLGREPKPTERFLVRSTGRVIVVKADEVDWIEAQGDYAGLHVGGKKHLVKEKMNKIEAQLDPAKFIRIHRSSIVNIDRIKELHPLFHGEYSLILNDGQKLTLSRSYRDRVLRHMKHSP